MEGGERTEKERRKEGERKKEMEEGDVSRRKKGESSKIQKMVMKGGERKEKGRGRWRKGMDEEKERRVKQDAEECDG